MIRTASKKPVFGAKLSLVKLALAITSIGLVFVAIQKVWAAPDDFITVWNSGDDRTIVIPVFNNSSTASQCGGVTYSQYNFTIDWGDGSPQESYSSAPTNPTHTYANANTEYTITISGYNFRGMTHDSNCTTGLTSTQAHNNAKKLLRVTNWSSSMNWSSMHGMFYNAENLTRVPVGYTFSSVKDMSYMFYNAKSFNYYVILDVPLVETTAYMFYGASSFNHQVNLYSTPKLTNTSHMFHGATAFNSSLGLSTTNVTNMSYMFRNATSFNQPVNFNTTNVTNMSYMFSGATSFNQPVNFDTAKVTNMRYMFNQAGSFNQPVNFNTSLVTDVSYMFYGASAFDQDLSGFSFNSMISNTHVMIYFVSYSGLSVTNYDNLIFK